MAKKRNMIMKNAHIYVDNKKVGELYQGEEAWFIPEGGQWFDTIDLMNLLTMLERFKKANKRDE